VSLANKKIDLSRLAVKDIELVGSQGKC